MSKTEMLRQSADAVNEKRLAQLSNQIESVRQAKYQSAQELAATLEPLAQAMAALTDETRQSLIEIERKSALAAVEFHQKITSTTLAWTEAAQAAQKAADSLNRAGARMTLNHYILTIVVALVTALLVSGFWLWLAPPKIQNQLDAEVVAQHLAPAVTAALKPSRGK